jgi:hypothetical protein
MQNALNNPVKEGSQLNAKPVGLLLEIRRIRGTDDEMYQRGELEATIGRGKHAPGTRPGVAP